MAKDSIKDEEQLVHTGSEGDFLGLTCEEQTLVEGADERIMLTGDERSHIENSANGSSAAPDGASTTELSAVAVQRCDAYQFSDGFTVELTEFWQQCQGGGGCYITYAGGIVLSKLWALRQMGLACNRFFEVAVEVMQLPLQGSDYFTDAGGNSLVCEAQAVAFGRQHFDHLSASGDHCLQGTSIFVWERTYFHSDRLGEGGEDGGVKGIGFGQLAGAAGKVSHLARIYHRHWKVSAGQDCGHQSFRNHQWPPRQRVRAASGPIARPGQLRHLGC